MTATKTELPVAHLTSSGRAYRPAAHGPAQTNPAMNGNESEVSLDRPQDGVDNDVSQDQLPS